MVCKEQFDGWHEELITQLSDEYTVIHQTIMMVSIKIDCTKVASEEMICTTKKSTADFVRTLRYKL